MQNTQGYISKIGRKHGKRIFLANRQSMEASTRLAQLNIEKYGVAKVKFSGTREKPFYSTTRKLSLQAGDFLSVPSEQLDVEKALKASKTSGTLTVVDMKDIEVSPGDLLKLTLSLMENHKIEFLTYRRVSTFCSKCQKSWFGSIHKCPACGSMGTLVGFDRFEGT